MLYLIMPANLPPEYFEAEKRFKEAVTHQEKVSALEALIATVPKHKGTDKLRGDLRKKLSKLREEAVRKKKGGGRDLYTVERKGASQVALVGLPNSGKSSLLSVLTNAHPVIADYPMSTTMPLSGMMPYEDIQFQIVDLPPIGSNLTDGWVSGVLRNADLLLYIIELKEDPEAEFLLEMASKWKIGPPKKAIIVGNKLDLPHAEDSLKLLKDKFSDAYPLIGVSAKTRQGLPELKSVIFKVSGIIRVYSKEPGKEPDMSLPFTLPSKTTVLRLAELIHKEFIPNLRYACVWGSSRFPGQRVQKDYVLKDKDIVEFHI